MTAVRPLVLVYQELAGVSGAAETPTLETLITGPCYHIQDYPADRGDTEITEYGVENSASGALGTAVDRPASGTEAMVLSGPPNNAIGAQLDHASVVVYMEDVLTEVTSGDRGEFSDVAPDENLFTAFLPLADQGVRPGDRLVVTTGTGATHVLQVQSVGGYAGNSEPATTLRTTTNYTDVDNDDLMWRVEHRVSEAVLPSSQVTLTENAITILGGTEIVVDVDGVDQVLPVNYARLFVEYRSLRKDLASLQDVTENNLETVLGIVDERNPLAAGANLALANTTTSIQVFGVSGDNLNGILDRANAYSQMAIQIQSRDDIYVIVPLTKDQDIVNAVHQHAVEFSSPEKSKFRSVIANIHDLPLLEVQAGPSVSGTSEINGDDPLSVFITDTAWDFIYVRTGDALHIVSATAAGGEGIAEVEGVLGDHRLYAPELDGFFSGEGESDVQGYILRGSGETTATFTGVATAVNTITVNPLEADTDHVGSLLRLTDTVTNTTTSPVGNSDFLITDVDAIAGEYTVVGPDLVIESGLLADVVSPITSFAAANTAHVRNAFRRVLDNSASFVTNGVIPSDVFQVPLPTTLGGAMYSSSVFEATVETVLSENRLEFQEGVDIPTVDLTTSQDETLGYRVIRSLNRAGQRDALLDVTDSQTGYNSSRLILIWPDECLLSNVQDNKTGTRTRQPGYYMACAVGGMSAGLPPHQGFTFLGVSGIEEIYHSSRYFAEDDLERISNGGWYVFLQDTSNSTPYCMHQLTTDTSDVRHMEFSVVRVYDYVSRFYKRILDQFIGRYNVTPQTLDTLRESLNLGTDQLKSDSLPRIGAPLIGAEIESIAQLDGQRDRVEIYMHLDLPVPLNRIGLRLTA